MFLRQAHAQSETQATAHGSQTRMSDAQIIQDLRTHLDKLVAQDRFSGSVLFAKNDQILFEHAYGWADHAFNVPNKVDTKFNLGSMGKMFTGVSIL
jgi:CubicO group peptidase (beta-lactamase class C family)